MAPRTPTFRGISPDWCTPFIAALAGGHTVSSAARLVKINPSRVYDYRKRHPDFADAWDDAYAQGTDLLEEEAQRRGMTGWDEPVFYQGEVVGAIRRYSDALLTTLLKARRPDKFRENYVVHRAPISALSSQELELARRAGRDPELEHAFDVLERALTSAAHADDPSLLPVPPGVDLDHESNGPASRED